MADPVSGRTLLVRVDQHVFWFEPPLGERLALDSFLGKTQEGVQYLLSHKFPLSNPMQKCIAEHVEYHETKAGFWKLCCFGICLPSGLLLSNTFDYDRDLDTVRKEVQAALTDALPATAFELAEHVQSEELFSGGGKPLFRVYLTG